MFLCELDGYAPAGGALRGKPALTLAEFDARFRTFLLDVYHRREHTETKAPPTEHWEGKGFLTQMERILEINGLHEITKAVVETARETWVIGEA